MRDAALRLSCRPVSGVKGALTALAGAPERQAATRRSWEQPSSDSPPHTRYDAGKGWTGGRCVKKLLITDVDNTLLDWQHLWFETFSAMASRVLEISGVAPERFYAECSAVHQRHGTRARPRWIDRRLILAGGS